MDRMTIEYRSPNNMIKHFQPTYNFIIIASFRHKKAIQRACEKEGIPIHIGVEYGKKWTFGRLNWNWCLMKIKHWPSSRGKMAWRKAGLKPGCCAWRAVESGRPCGGRGGGVRKCLVSENARLGGSPCPP